jgi:hypothetical protein
MTTPTTSNNNFMRQWFEELWNGPGILLAVDPKHSQVVLPEYLYKQDAHIVLDYDPCAIVPINDLHTNDEGIKATLSFDRIPCHTFVPWGAIKGFLTRGSAPLPLPADDKPKPRLTIVK